MPDPWVEVEITPATVWASYPPICDSARPFLSSTWLSARMRMPASTRSSGSAPQSRRRQSTSSGRPRPSVSTR